MIGRERVRDELHARAVDPWRFFGQVDPASYPNFPYSHSVEALISDTIATLHTFNIRKHSMQQRRG